MATKSEVLELCWAVKALSVCILFQPRAGHWWPAGQGCAAISVRCVGSVGSIRYYWVVLGAGIEALLTMWRLRLSFSKKK